MSILSSSFYLFIRRKMSGIENIKNSPTDTTELTTRFPTNPITPEHVAIIGNLDLEKTTELKKQAYNITKDFNPGSLEWTKIEIFIDNLPSIPESNLLQRKVKWLKEWSGETYKKLIEIEGHIANVLTLQDKNRMNKFRSAISRIPVIGKKINNNILNNTSLESFLKNIDDWLNQSLKRIDDQKADLELQKQQIYEDVQKLKEHYYLLFYIVAELEGKIKNMPESNSVEKALKDNIKNNTFLPLKLKLQSIVERVLVNLNAFSQCNILQNSATNIQISLKRARDVTLYAATVHLATQSAVNEQKKVFDAIKQFGVFTNNLIENTSKHISTQAVEITANSMQTSSDINTIKKSFEEIQWAIKKITDIYNQAIPTIEHNIEEMENIARQGITFLNGEEKN